MNRIVIDVREPSEFIQGHVDCALNIPLSTLTASAEPLQDIAQDAEIIVYCRSGGRASVAAQKLNAIGFTNITNGINQQQVFQTYQL